jgi:hypothetical protein
LLLGWLFGLLKNMVAAFDEVELKKNVWHSLLCLHVQKHDKPAAGCVKIKNNVKRRNINLIKI